MKTSVCIATYNGARWLRAQIDSILPQLKPGDELLVSDDGSTDETLQILKSYGVRLRIVGTTRIGGVVPNFERVLSAASGDIVVLADQDDVWLDGRLNLIRAQLDKVTLIMTNGKVVDADLKPTGQDVYQLVNFHNGFLRTFASTKYVGCCMAFRRELLQVALPFPAHIQWHDWYLALIGELLFKVSHTQQTTILFRRHENNASNTGQRSSASILKKLKNRFWMMRATAIATHRFFTRKQ